MTENRAPGCAAACWRVAAVVGVVVGALLLFFVDWSLIPALLAVAVVWVGGGFTASWLLCKPLPSPGPSVDHGPAEEPEARATEPSAPAEVESAAVEPAPVEPALVEPVPATGAPQAPVASVKPSRPLPGQEELAGRKGSWKYEKAAVAPAEPAAVSQAPATAPGEAHKPTTLPAPREGGPDDLKAIKGVGPKLEALLHSMGIYHFDQIAAWTGQEVAWVDANLEGFKGRVTRDGWVSQARTLSEGGQTEFSRRNS